MGKRSQLCQNKVQNIVQLSLKGKCSLEIARKLKRDHRTIKKFLTEGKVTCSKQKCTKPKASCLRDERKVKNALLRMPHSASKIIFEAAGLSKVPKSTRNDYLRKIGNIKKKISTLVLIKKTNESDLNGLESIASKI